ITPIQATPPPTVAQVMGARVGRPSVSSPSTTSTTVPEGPPAAMQADTPSEIIAALEQLPVEEEHGDYRRSKFGFYKDVDEDSCNTREEVIVAEALQINMNTNTCNIFSGKWFSPFDGRSTENHRDMRAEHVVSLEEAYDSGAWKWQPTERNAYLNDLTHAETLVAVSEASSIARNGEDPGGWLPTNDKYLCDYLRTYVYIKTIYKMSVDAGERESIAAAALYC
ncbi:MAG: hypothetical protein Q8K63_01670, partial [Acidimicrobiales bacterium]|nr:hypothetical protein [Acidimicrobiales bacterium]